MHEIIIQRVSSGSRVPKSVLLRRFVKAALDKCEASRRRPGSTFENVEITLRIVGIAEMTELNARYRQKNKPTNVLSFPALLPETLNLPVHMLGDIVICADVVNREAQEQHKQAEAHWAHMVIHGVCHLAGYDHETDEEAQVMEQVETEIMHNLGFQDPYHQGV